ncbi:hypothetical protein HY065_00180 [Candidatus Berkelbacteria bacterium]|nr:hypothetical protein [Candidatus Berkelbacteria bacterium]
MIKVVLTKDVDKLGKLGETKNVADGFAMHWLIPQGFAVFDDTRLARKLARLRASLDQKVSQASEQAIELSKKHHTKSAQRISQKIAKDAKKINQLKTT